MSEKNEMLQKESLETLNKINDRLRQCELELWRIRNSNMSYFQGLFIIILLLTLVVLGGFK